MNNNLLREPQLDYSNLDPKLIGRYYTPLSVARSLVNWAVTRKDSRILDPSFGGCSFFDASVTRLTEFGEARPGKHLYGVAIASPCPKIFDVCTSVTEVLHRTFSPLISFQPRHRILVALSIQWSAILHMFGIILSPLSRQRHLLSIGGAP